MASQLIYTSAPRLLEAGRTGFGTVARHRAVSGLLVAAVERVSQFARLPGVNPRRVVLSHRIIHAGAASYHVLSCIRDAGSDYTGRTHHLAHHLIADAREARAAAEDGLTPADILRQMRWRTEWNESPRFFEPDEEIPLTSFRRSTSGGAWQRLTGNPAHASLPAQAQRCCLLLPGDDGALGLYQESLATIGGTAAWLVTFTTHLEPTDDLAELRWLALAATSPLRQVIEGAVRTTFDLTDPQSLPAPRLPEMRVAATPARALPRPGSAPHTVPATAVPASPLPDIFTEPKASQKRSPWPLVTVAVLCAIAGITAFVLLPKLPSLAPSAPAPQNQDAVSIARAVDDLWQKHRLNLPVTRNWLKAQGSAALLESHAQTLKQMTAVIREPLSPQEIQRPENTQDEFMDMIQHFTNWQQALRLAMRDETWSGRHPQDILTAADTALTSLDQHWQRFASAFSIKPVQPETLRVEIHQKVMKTLAQAAEPEGSARDWLELHDLTNTSTSAAWITHWQIISRLPATPTRAERDALEQATKSADAPVWFRQLTQKRLDIALASIKAPTPPPAGMPAAEPAPARSDEPVQPADGTASSHPRHIIIVTPSFSLDRALEALPTLPGETDMQVLAGPAGTTERELTRWKQLGAPGVYRKSFNDSNTLEFRQLRLIKLPAGTDALRIIARDKSGVRVLFEVVVFPQNAALVDAWPASEQYTFRDRREGARTMLDSAGSRWVQCILVAGGAPLRIQHVEDPTRRFLLKNEGSSVFIHADAAAAPGQETGAASKAAELDREIESLSQGIRIDEQRRAGIESGNLARQQKEEALRRLDDSLTVRQQRLLQLQEDRKALFPEAPSFLGLPAGIYSLSVGRRRLCEIKILSGP